MRTKVSTKPTLKWTNCGDFSVHYANGAAVIHSHFPVIKQIMEIVDDWFNPYQYFLFRRCLYGMDVYNQEEMRYISSQKKKRIQNVHRHSLEVINLYKQRLVVEYTNKILLHFFPKCKNALDLISCSELDNEFRCDIPLEKLNITRKDIAKELVEKKCLPHNFFSLTIHDDPRMIKLKAPQPPLDAL